MVIYEWEFDSSGAGQYHKPSTRYVPVNGGSRTALPVADDMQYPRYYGFVGMDEELTESIHLMDEWYSYLGGQPAIPKGCASEWVQRLLSETAHSTAPRERE